MIHHGDLFDVLPTLDADSIDACVTDPPYGLEFMGKGWDAPWKTGDDINADAGFAPFQLADGAVRLPKPSFTGSTNPKCLNCGGTKRGRQDGTAKRAVCLCDAPQFKNVRAVEMRAFQQWSERWARDVFRVLKPGGYLVAFGSSRTYHRMACAIEDAGFEMRDSLCWLYGSGFPKSLNLGDGKGTALKPAHEPIALAWKPFKGTITACHATHGTAALNVDACRIGTDDVIEPFGTRRKSSGGIQNVTDEIMEPFKQHAQGRWPANVLLDEEAAALLDAQTGELTSGANPTRRSSDKFRDTYSAFKGQTECEAARGVDVGGASRFYYVAKPSREERDYGTHELTAKPRDDSRKDGNPGGDNPRNRGLQARGNHHPTVKPVELMRWLVKLVTPIDGIVLDPFTGSGTTGMACRYEHRRFVGIEREADYIQIAERRIAAVAPLFGEATA